MLIKIKFEKCKILPPIMLVADSYLKPPKLNKTSSSSIFMSGRDIETYHSNLIKIACLQLLVLIYFSASHSLSAVLFSLFFLFDFISI